MITLNNKKTFQALILILIFSFAGFLVWYFAVSPVIEASWQQQFAVPSEAIFNGNMVTIKNVRNFRYSPTEKDQHPNYYDKTYDLSTVKAVWYISEPFNENKLAAHTFLSFEFENGDFLAITIEAKKKIGQEYSTWKGIMRNYPLMYIATDERDSVMLRANVRQDKVYVYPVKLSKPENAEALLTDMLVKMNKLNEEPEWYNTIWHNCTSEIAYHVNRISGDRISSYSWEYFITSEADKFALENGLLDTKLTIEDAREKYLITEKSLTIGDVLEYSKLIREE
ncbi:MAG: DUF4105 domain-containing protein [Minisyncoccia bacterium]